MSARLEVVKDQLLQRVWFYPRQGRPTATPSVAIKSDAGTTIAAASTTGVTQDAVNTTVSTASAAGDDTLTLTAVTSIEWRQTYLVTNAALQQEWVRVKGVNASTKVVTLDEPLVFAHDTAATFVGTRFYRTLTASEVDELVELYRARAEYVVGGLNYIQEIPFDVVKTPLENPLTVEFLRRRRPDIMAFEPASSRGSDFADFRELAWEEVKRGIRQAGWRPGLVRTPEDIDEWAIAEFDLLARKNGVSIILPGWDAEKAVLHLEAARNTAQANSLRSIKFLDLNEDDSADVEEEAPLRMDFVR